MSYRHFLIRLIEYSCRIAYREPETYQELLLCAEWGRARKRERDALFKSQVMRVVPTPPGARPIKSRYVYKRKYDKDGTSTKYKALLSTTWIYMVRYLV